jgi:hypothetical protein
MTGYIIAASVTAYSGIMLWTARKLFARWRPSRVVVKCIRQDRSGYHVVECPGRKGKSDHWVQCHRRMRPNGSRIPVDWHSEAVVYALAGGVVWPLVLGFYGIPWMVTARQPELPDERSHRLEQEKAELQAHIDRLQREVLD